jgi:hypothetical protein
MFIGAFVLAVLCVATDNDTEYQEYRRARHDFFMQHNRRSYDREPEREREDDSAHDRRASIFSFGGER